MSPRTPTTSCATMRSKHATTASRCRRACTRCFKRHSGTAIVHRCPPTEADDLPELKPATFWRHGRLFHSWAAARRKTAHFAHDEEDLTRRSGRPQQLAAATAKRTSDAGAVREGWRRGRKQPRRRFCLARLQAGPKTGAVRVGAICMPSIGGPARRNTPHSVAAGDTGALPSTYFGCMPSSRNRRTGAEAPAEPGAHAAGLAATALMLTIDGPACWCTGDPTGQAPQAAALGPMSSGSATDDGVGDAAEQAKTDFVLLTLAAWRG